MTKSFFFKLTETNEHKNIPKKSFKIDKESVWQQKIDKKTVIFKRGMFTACSETKKILDNNANEQNDGVNVIKK